MRAEELKLREVVEDDCRDLYDWRNHPVVRQNSFNKEIFLFDDHKKWFKAKLNSAKTTIFIATCGANKIGVVRFENEEDGVKVNVMLNPDYIGRGLGTQLIRLGIKEFQRRHKTDKLIIAEIKEDNAASIKAFENAGFRKSHLTYVFKPEDRRGCE